MPATVKSGPSEKARRAAELFKQAADPTRVTVLALLSERERNVTELCGELPGTSQPALSHHLSLLKIGRLIECRRDGKHNFYGLTETGKALAGVVGNVTEGGK